MTIQSLLIVIAIAVFAIALPSIIRVLVAVLSVLAMVALFVVGLVVSSVLWAVEFWQKITQKKEVK